MQSNGPEHCIGGVSIAFWPSFHDLRRAVGLERAEELLADPAAYETAKRAIAEAEMLDAGVIPPWFTMRGKCDQCGPVPLPDHSRPDVRSCPWCRAANVPRMSHAKFVRRAQERRDRVLASQNPAVYTYRLQRCADGWFYNAPPDNTEPGE